MIGWHKPGRNATHPGDPPPRWALRSRASKVIMALTVVVGLVIGLILATTRTVEALV